MYRKFHRPHTVRLMPDASNAMDIPRVLFSDCLRCRYHLAGCPKPALRTQLNFEKKNALSDIAHKHEKNLPLGGTLMVITSAKLQGGNSALMQSSETLY